MDSMPVIIFEGSKLTRDQKAELIKQFTEAAHKTTGIAKEAFVVFIHENERESIGVGGEPLADRLK
jgi:4-oxalocrotonate tautomerase